MSSIILNLRNFSLRWSIVILFVTTIISGLGAISSGGSFTVTGFILVAGLILFYGTWCAQVIADVKKAGITFAILAIAMIINFFGQMDSLSESPDFVGMAFNAVFGDGSALNDWVYKKIMYSYKTTLLLNILSTGAFIYAFTGVDDKYKVSWAIMAAAFAISAFNLYSLANGNRDIEAYQSLNNIVAWITVLVFIILLVQGNNKTIIYYTDQSQSSTNYTSGNAGKDNSSTSYKTLGIIAGVVVLVIIIVLCVGSRSDSYDYDSSSSNLEQTYENYYPESYELEAPDEEVEQPAPYYYSGPSYNNDYSSDFYDDNSADVWE